ncbi:hypothetical protein M885DRAFT_453658 [Pelagophyceae sp. CCMP2097]|nr:hypothetical protein M885DRAFT_453658 [Pelagophyceae sp. CCMP2097]
MRNAAEDALGAAKGRIGDETEKNVYEAINNKNWGASGSVLSDIARDTYSYDKFAKIFKIVWEAGDSSPRNWRKIFKALMLAEYLVKNGCERCVDEIRDHSFRLRQLQEFNYYEERVDRGQGVREKAKQIIELLADNEQIREKREESKKLRDKFVGHGSISQAKFGGHGSTVRAAPRDAPARGGGPTRRAGVAGGPAVSAHAAPYRTRARVAAATRTAAAAIRAAAAATLTRATRRVATPSRSRNTSARPCPRR